jgi:hypothetical protein
VARFGRALGVPVSVFTPSGGPGDSLMRAVALGAVRELVRPGYASVVARRAEEAAEQRGWFYIRPGLDHEEAVAEVAKQARETPWPRLAYRLVVPVGSGVTFCGVLRAMADGRLGGRDVLGVVVGGDPTKRLAKYVPAYRWLLSAGGATTVRSPLPYETPAEAVYYGMSFGDLRLDPYYEAKCVPYLRPGDVLWAVA